MVTCLYDGRGLNEVCVTKEECINHVEEILGTRLLNLKKDLLVYSKTKSGKTVMRNLIAGKTV